MKITNRLGLPEEIHRAAQVVLGAYNRGDAQISITGLSDPPRKAVLEMLHEEELEEDVADVIWALLGSTLHGLLHAGFDQDDRAADHFAEERLFAQMEGWKVSGALDLYRRGHIRDYKFTSIYGVKYGKPKPEWEQQMNGYAWLLRENGLEATSAEVVVFLRDWSKLDSFKDHSYPRHQVTRIPVPLWPADVAENWVRNRVLAHQAALHELPLCTPEERWAKTGAWAVVKPGTKRAVKLHPTHADAAKHALELGKGHVVESRPGQFTRCLAYCAAAPFCTQAAGLEKE